MAPKITRLPYMGPRYDDELTAAPSGHQRDAFGRARRPDLDEIERQPRRRERSRVKVPLIG